MASSGKVEAVPVEKESSYRSVSGDLAPLKPSLSWTPSSSSTVWNDVPLEIDVESTDSKVAEASAELGSFIDEKAGCSP
jgi:hypothetical protein